MRGVVAIGVGAMLVLTGCGSKTEGHAGPLATMVPGLGAATEPAIPLYVDSTAAYGGAAYVRTASGKTTFILYASQIEAQNWDFEKTFHTADGHTANGFLYLPGPGTIEWRYGNMGLGSEAGQHPTILNYDKTYTAFDWIVTPTSKGTTLTRDGHGLRVSTTSVTAF